MITTQGLEPRVRTQPNRGRRRHTGTSWAGSVTARLVVGIGLWAMWTAAPASGQTAPPGRVAVAVEGLNVWQQRNDVRIPPEAGTEFSIVDLIGSSPTPSVRLTVTADVTDRQQLQVIYAPLQVSGRGTLGTPIDFAGTTFAAAPAEAVYKFSSYRATWSYRVYQGPTWTWRSASRVSSAMRGLR